MIQQIFKFLGAEIVISQKVNHDAGVKIPGARSHGNAARGRKAHRGVDRYPVSKRAQAQPVSQMRKDGFFWKRRPEMMHQRFIRNAVKAIAADPTVEVALRKGQMRCDFGNRLMESVVEARELSSRRKDRLRGSDQR